MQSTLRIDRAEPMPENLKAILGLIEQAKQWLSSKGTDQWRCPWPDQEARNARIWRGLEVGATWIAWVRNKAAATVTVAKTPNPDIWRDADCNLGEPAVYAYRLIVDRQFAGQAGSPADRLDRTLRPARLGGRVDQNRCLEH